MKNIKMQYKGPLNSFYRIFISSMALISVLVFSGCQSGAYSRANVGEIEQIYTATIKSTRVVELQDSGSGKLFGAIVGALAGHQLGKGKGNTAATVGGALAGGVAGNELNKALGQEIHLLFDDGRNISTTIEINNNQPYSFRAGDVVNVYMSNGRISQIKMLK